MNNFDLIVIGGGPGGIFAAITASERGLKVGIIEKNKRIGNKILIAGSGKCNLTHTGEVKEFLTKYGENGKFLKKALNDFSPEDLKIFFLKNNLPLTLVEESGKFFPKTFSSLDVVELLKNKIRELKIEVILNYEIKKIEKKNSLFYLTNNEIQYISKNILLATGGKSFPETGTTGDGYIYAKQLGHDIVPQQPALTPIYVKEYQFEELSGISFKNVKINIWKDNKKIVERKGVVLLTHTNFSGPGILDNSRYIEHESKLEINYVGVEYEEFNKEIIEASNKDGKRTIKKHLLKYSLPERFLKKILELVEVDESMKLSEISRSKREELARALTSNKMEILKVGNFKVAMATKGGVSLKDVNSKTMESKITEGLYFAGEVLDIDGDTGGYNIQAACSMGVLAGKSIKK